MQTPVQKILDRCKEMVVKAKELYGMDLSGVHISFDLRGSAAGRAGGKGYRMPSSAYTAKFNRDMLGREAFDHVHDETVPHEYAHIICFMNPGLGKNHDHGWTRVCRALGGSGARCHREEVVYGKGLTYEYVTDRGHTVRLSQQKHKKIQMGSVLTYSRGRTSLGKVDKTCAHSIVGHRGRTLEAPIVKTPALAPNHPAVIENFVRTKEIPVAQFRMPMFTAPRVAAPEVAASPAEFRGMSKVQVARALMVTLHREGKSYEEIIATLMRVNGHSRQLARVYYAGNVVRCGVPPAP